MNKIGLFLMTSKGLSALNSLCNNGYADNISFVEIGQDSNLKDDNSSEIEALCIQHNIEHHYRGKENISYNIDYALAISWRWLLPTDVFRLIVLHDSILPKYRGFAPLVNQLVNHEQEVGVTALFADADTYDTGDIIAQQKTQIQYPIKIAQAIEQVSGLYDELCLDIFKSLTSKGAIIGTPQDESQASYSLWRDNEDYRINWGESAERIRDLVNFVGVPYLGASCILENQLIRILEADLREDVVVENRDVGKVIFMESGEPTVVCGSGLLTIRKAIYDSTGESLLPMKKFRVRFK